MHREAIRSHISSHTLFNLAANIYRVVLGSFILIFVARKLGPEDYGIVSLGLSIAAIVGLFCDFGVTTSAARYLADSDSIDTLTFQTGRFLNIVASIFFSFLLLLVANRVTAITHVDSPAYIQITCIFIFFTSMFQFSIGALQGIKQTHRIALLNLIQNTLVGACVLGAVVVGFKAGGVLIGYSIAAALTWAISLIIVQQYFKGAAIAINIPLIKKILLYALPLLLTSSSYFLLIRGPLVLLSAFSGTKEVSFLNIPMRIVEVAALPAFSLSMVTAPFFTARGNLQGESQKWLYVKILKYSLFMYLPLGLLLLLGAPKIIAVVFGNAYARAAATLRILAVFLPFFATATFTSRILDFLGVAKQKAVIFAGTTATTIFLSFLIIPKFQETGAAAAISAPYIGFSIYTIFKSARVCKVEIARYTTKITKLVMVAILSCFPAYVLFRMPSQSIFTLLVAFACSIALFGVLGIKLGLIKSAEIKSILRSFA